ncbi:MAG: tRNA (guanosine(37)-N1)-methyltransferase TrmD [Sarcina sp.]
MKISILTLFPEMFDVFSHSIIGRARENKEIEINTVDIRSFTLNKHKKVDDSPYGGGAGMVMSPQPVIDAIRAVKQENNGKVIFLGPRGKTFNQDLANSLANEENLIFICGHYEGIDERAYKYFDMEISIGDYILTGGEMAAIPVIDSICRVIPGVLGKQESFEAESFYDGTLEYPQYTRPFEFEGEKIPEILISGHHENIRKWRRKKSLILTKNRRPDLFKKLKLSKEDINLLKDKEKFVD